MPDHVEPVKAEWSNDDLNVIWSEKNKLNYRKKRKKKKQLDYAEDNLLVFEFRIYLFKKGCSP